MAMQLKLLTSSSQNAFKRCPRLYYYSYVLCFKACTPGEAREFGTMMHKALEAYWRARKNNLGPDERFAAAEATLPPIYDLEGNQRPDAFKIEKARALLVGYCSRWDAKEDIVVLGVERQFQLPLINPDTGHASRTWVLGGKLDVIVFMDGKVQVIEHKTSSEDTEAGSVYRQRLTMDGQVSQYFEGGDVVAKKLGRGAIDEVAYDIIQKIKLRPHEATPPESRKYTKEKPEKRDKKTGEIISPAEPSRLYAGQRERDETPEEFFDRCIDDIQEHVDEYFDVVQIVRLEVEREEYAWDLWQTAEMIQESTRKKRFPKNPANCFVYGKPCDFWHVCTRQSSLDNPFMFQKKDDAHEELIDDEETTTP